MTVCTFYLKGNCRYGNHCKYEHVDGGSKKGTTLPGPDSFSVIAKTIQDDIVTEKPAYFLSVYSPQKSCPNMIGGTDLSPEELRFQAYQARANNTLPQYIAHESQLLQKMDSIIQLVSSSPIEAYKHFYHTQMPLNHPNSTFRNATPGITTFGGNSFGSSNSTTAFGQPTSAFGAPSMGAFGAFGKQAPAPAVSAFGQPSPARPAASAFGQPQSAFGLTGSQPNTVTAFGNPSPFGAPATSAPAFGSTPTATPFGQPSRFGTTAFGTTAPQPTGATAFGAPSAFGASTSTVTAFGQSSLNNTTNAFGVPAGTTPATSFTQSAGAAPATGFGQPSAFGQPQVASAFGQPSAFGQSAFGKSAGFGAAAANPTPVATTAFGQSAFGTSSSSTAFGQAPSSISANSQPPQNVGFAAFAGATTTPSKPSNDFGMGTTTPPQVSDGSKPQVPSFQQPSTTATSSFHQASTPNLTQQSIISSHNNNDKLIEQFKSLDPFWEDAPVESDLSPDILQAFKAEKFSWGSIPNVPPPISLR